MSIHKVRKMPQQDKQKVFVIKHGKTARQKRAFDRLSVPLRHLPEELYRKTVPCPSCGFVFRPDWLKKHEISMAPVKPKWETKGAKYTGPARWVLNEIRQPCPRCRTLVPIQLPVNKMKTKGYLFGDDAERRHPFQNEEVYLYSLVGMDQSLLPEFERKLKNLKEQLLPSVPADKWTIHMRHMWAGSGRKKHLFYQSLDLEGIIGFVNKLFALIREGQFFVYNIALPTIRNSAAGNKIERQLRNLAFIMLVMNVINEWTGKGGQPHIFFDSEKDSNADETIHAWARDFFEGSKYSLLYGFLSKGIEIPEPRFVRPASRPGLELADVVSFVIAEILLENVARKRN